MRHKLVNIERAIELARSMNLIEEIMTEKRDTQAVSIRFPRRMYRRIKSLAERQHRSFNLQVVHLLKDALSRVTEKDAPERTDSIG